MKTTINTNERIFQVYDFEGNIYLCNLVDLSIYRGELHYSNKLFSYYPVKKIKHYWNFNFVTISKIEVCQMLYDKNLNY